MNALTVFAVAVSTPPTNKSNAMRRAMLRFKCTLYTFPLNIFFLKEQETVMINTVLHCRKLLYTILTVSDLILR